MTVTVRKFGALLLAGALILALAAGCGSEEPTATPIPPPPTALPDITVARATATLAPQAAGICAQGKMPSYLKQVVLAKDVQGTDLTPVNVTTTFTPDQPAFHAVAMLDHAPAGVKLRAVWYLVQASGFQPNSKIDETEPAVSSASSGNVDFRLKPVSGTWPPGKYCVEIYAEGNLALSLSFEVAGGAQAPAVNPIQAIVLAESVQPETKAPVNPTDTFNTGAPFIYAAVQIKDSPPGTIYKAIWYPPGIQPLEFEQSPGPNEWIVFHLTPGSNGFPSGDYKVEFYVNEQLVDARTFKVE